jgi:L-amino acid N-acyltransferase YncA
MMNESPRYPRRIRTSNAEFELRLMSAGDAEAALAFAATLPPHDLLFLQRDIRSPKVVAAWLEQIERGTITSLLAVADGNVCGCTAIVRDMLSWSPHVGEMRIVVSQSARGAGLGRLLAQEAFAFAVSNGIEKLIARMTPDQGGAMAVFEEMGFRPEALLRDFVKDSAGLKHDIVILSLDVEQNRAQREAYGYNEAF